MAIEKHEFILSPLKKAFETFKRFYKRADPQDEMHRAAVIKAFEYSYELSWKSVKKVLEILGYELIQQSPRAVFREAAKANIIQDPEIWFSFIEQRNNTAHVYNVEVSADVYNLMDEFSEELEKLIHKLEQELRS